MSCLDRVNDRIFIHSGVAKIVTKPLVGVCGGWGCRRSGIDQCPRHGTARDDRERHRRDSDRSSRYCDHFLLVPFPAFWTVDSTRSIGSGVGVSLVVVVGVSLVGAGLVVVAVAVLAVRMRARVPEEVGVAVAESQVALAGGEVSAVAVSPVARGALRPLTGAPDGVTDDARPGADTSSTGSRACTLGVSGGMPTTIKPTMPAAEVMLVSGTSAPLNRFAKDRSPANAPVATN